MEVPDKTSLISAAAYAQKKTEPSAPDKNNPWKTETFNGLSFRSIGPAITSGRVIDPLTSAAYTFPF